MKTVVVRGTRRGAAHQPGDRRAVEAGVDSRRLADGGGDDDGTGGPHDHDPRSRPNLTIITARHYSRVKIDAEAPRPILADVTKASADELRAVWGPFVGEAGTYEVTTGNLITMRPIAAKNPAVMGPGVFITYTYKLDGDTIWVTQQRNQHGPFANPVTIKAVRIE